MDNYGPVDGDGETVTPLFPRFTPSGLRWLTSNLFGHQTAHPIYHHLPATQRVIATTIATIS